MKYNGLVKCQKLFPSALSIKRFLLLACLILIFAAGLFNYTEAQSEESWSVLSGGVTNDLNNVACTDDRTCFAVGGAPFIGGSGVILKTADGGNTWTRQTIPTTNPLRGITCPTSSICYAAGDGGALLKTTNGGSPWTLLGRNTQAAEQYYWDIAAYDASNATAVGNAGTIYRTTDGGAAWRRISSGTGENLHRVYFANGAIGWIVGSGGTVLKTINGGANWLPLSTPSGMNGLFDVFSRDGLNTWVGGDVGRLLKSANGGVVWSLVRPDTFSTFRAVEFVSGTAGFIAGSGTIKKTVDGGMTWTDDLPRGLSASVRGMSCPSADVCYAVGDDGVILRRGVSSSSASGENEASAAASGGAQNAFGSNLTSEQKRIAESPGKRNAATKNARGVSINPGILNQNRIALNLFANKSFIAERGRSEEKPGGVKIWKGNLEGKPESKVTLVSKGNVTAGNIHTEEGIYEIRYAGNGAHTIRFVDPKLLPEELNPKKLPRSNESASAVYTPPPPSEVAPATVDVAVLITPDAYAAIGGEEDAADAFVELMFQEANLAHELSNTDIRLHNVRWTVVSSRIYNDSGSFNTDLDTISEDPPPPGNRLASFARSVRDDSDADIVTLLIRNGGNACGIGWLMDEENQNRFANFAYNVVDVDCVSNYSFIHELGHNMGLGHDRDNHDDDFPPRFSYAYGYQDPQERFRTIMSYQCEERPCPRIPFFSNPDILYQGIPFGTATENNARALRNVRFTVADYSESRDGGSAGSSADAAADFREKVGAETPESAPGGFRLFFRNTSRTIKSLFTFDDKKKAELELQFANENLLEAQQLSSSGNKKAAESQFKKFSESLDKAEAVIKNLEGNNQEEAAAMRKKLLDNQLRQQELLRSIQKESKREEKEKLRGLREKEASRLERVAEGVPPETLKQVFDKASVSDAIVLERVADKIPAPAKKIIKEAEVKAPDAGAQVASKVKESDVFAKPAERLAEKSIEVPVEKPIGKPAEKPIEKSAPKIIQPAQTKAVIFPTLISPSKSAPSVQKQKCASNPSPVFTNHITDMSKVSYIVPPPTMGSGPSLKPHSYIGTNGAKVPVYAPVAMTLKDGSHYVGGPYMFDFTASCEVTLRFGHITDPADSIKKLLPTKPNSDSRTQELPPVSFAAGDLIGYTTGTDAAGNWDFGVFNSSTSNRYANDPKWNNSIMYTTAVCPFDYFEPVLKEIYVSKFNSNALGGNPPHGESFCK